MKKTVNISLENSPKSKFVEFLQDRRVGAVVEDIANGAAGLRFDSRAGQIGQRRHHCDFVAVLSRR